MRLLLLALAALLCWSGRAHAEDAPASQAVLTIQPSRPMLSQGDPAWRSLPIGTTTIGKSGCLAFSLMDALASMGLSFSSPSAFIELLKQNGLFTRSGLLVWDLDRLFPVTATRVSIAGNAAYEEAKQKLSEGASVLLEVATVRGTRHWIVASKVTDGGIEVRDPNGGRTGMLESLYGISSLRGLAVIQKQ